MPTPPPLPSDSDSPPPPPDLEQQVDDGKGRVFPCHQCGADLEFHIDDQDLKCPYCGAQQALESDGREVSEQDLEAMLQQLSEQRGDQAPQADDLHEIQCSSCAAHVQFTGTLTSTSCAYCGSPIQRTDVHDAEATIAVDGVLPFQIDREKARNNLREWINSRWFVPSGFSGVGVRDKFQGVYLPFWTYDALTSNHYEGERGEHYTVTVGSGDDKRTETRTRWYPASGSFRRFFDDVLVNASIGLPEKQLTRLQPWPLQKCTPFQAELLAGYFSRTYDVDLRRGFQTARGRMDQAIDADVRNRIGGDEQRVHSIDTHYGALTYKHLLLPVWMLAYQYGDKSYRVLVNAATGEVQGERPWSWIKITGLVVTLLAVTALIVFLANR